MVMSCRRGELEEFSLYCAFLVMLITFSYEIDRQGLLPPSCNRKTGPLRRNHLLAEGDPVAKLNRDVSSEPPTPLLLCTLVVSVYGEPVW